MGELQRVVRANAKLQTTADVLDDKVREASDVYAQTQEKAQAIQRAVAIASDKYEELLKILSRRKIEHRDQVSRMAAIRKQSEALRVRAAELRSELEASTGEIRA
jgi:transposase-like protein